MQIRSVAFLGGSDTFDMLPVSTGAPEVAFIGRSNVGKSSLINRLCAKRDLARVSKTPGRTQQVNLFSIKLAPQSRKNIEIVLADLPGFGFARLSKGKKEEIQESMFTYIERRDALSVVCLLNEIRRDPEEEEHELVEFCKEHGRKLLVVVTKCDKVSRNELARRLRAIATCYRVAHEDLIATEKDCDPRLVWQRITGELLKERGVKEEGVTK